MTNNISGLLPKYVECYAALAKERIIFISEDITKDTASSLSGMLLYYDSENDAEDISIYINTNGGDSHALSNIYDVMQMIKSPIKTVCIGKAYSAGALILAAGTKGKRFITKNAAVMVHGIQFTFPNGPVSDQRDSEIYFKYIKDHNHMILNILAKHTGQTIEKILEDCKKDNYFDAKQALEYGIVDEII
jgi:ATP-dependent Clp protease protease subunit